MIRPGCLVARHYLEPEFDPDAPASPAPSARPTRARHPLSPGASRSRGGIPLAGYRGCRLPGRRARPGREERGGHPRPRVAGVSGARPSSVPGARRGASPGRPRGGMPGDHRLRTEREGGEPHRRLELQAGMARSAPGPSCWKRGSRGAAHPLRGPQRGPEGSRRRGGGPGRGALPPGRPHGARRRRRWGLTDAYRTVYAEGEEPEKGLYTWWDYTRLAFARNVGARIDHIYLTGPLAGRIGSVRVDRDERRQRKGEDIPSDHAPVLCDLDFP